MVIVANKTHQTDGAAYSLLEKINTHIPIVLISRAEGFKFNEELLGLKKYVLVDYVEYLWFWDRANTHIWGENTKDFKENIADGEYDKFDKWVKNNPPVLTLKRELLKKDVRPNLLPIEYPCLFSEPLLTNREEYNSRPINVLFYWGRSHEARCKLHGNFWTHSSEVGSAVCDNIYYLEDFIKEEQNTNKWVTLNIPHYSRLPMETIMRINGMSKISVSTPGSGVKCFRHGESPSNSLMAIEENDFAWSYPWDETNSIQIEVGNEIEALNDAIRRDDLYDVYQSGLKNCNNYRIKNYIANYLEPLINNA